MASAEFIVSALVRGAAACRNRAVREGLPRAYRELDTLVAVRLPTERRGWTRCAAEDPQAWSARLAGALRQARADSDDEVIAAAQRLMALFNPPRSTGGVDNDRGSGGGEPPGGVMREGPEPRHAVAHRPGQVAAGHPTSPGRRAGEYWRAGARDFPAEGQGPPESVRADGDLWDDQRHSCDWVIVIDRCSGIQVGKDNDQLSVYRVTLPDPVLEAPQKLAEQLLRDGWAGDLFSNNASTDPGAPPGRLDADSSGIVQSPRGNTLVIVRNSSGVQIGNDNVQRNDFRIRLAHVLVRADGLGTSRARQEAVRRLIEDPADEAAARRLAADVAGAARASLQEDLAQRMREQVGQPHIRIWSGELTGLTGRQVGWPGQARVKVLVTVERPDPDALARAIRDAARRRQPPQAPPSPGQSAWTGTAVIRGHRRTTRLSSSTGMVRTPAVCRS